MLGGGNPEQKKPKRGRSLFSQPSLHQLAGQAKPGDGVGLAAHRLLKQLSRDRRGGSEG